MKKKEQTKCIKLSGETLKTILEVAKATKRNYTGATEYLIANGLEVYYKEQQLMKTLRKDSIEELLMPLK
jgi:hypothetical protein